MEDILSIIMYVVFIVFVVVSQVYVTTWSLTQIFGYQVHWFPVLILMYIFGVWKE